MQKSLPPFSFSCPVFILVSKCAPDDPGQRLKAQLNPSPRLEQCPPTSSNAARTRSWQEFFRAFPSTRTPSLISHHCSPVITTRPSPTVVFITTSQAKREREPVIETGDHKHLPCPDIRSHAKRTSFPIFFSLPAPKYHDSGSGF